MPGRTLALLPDRLAVCRLPPADEVPSWAWTGPLASVTRTAEELSVVCAESAVPDDVQAERGWRAMRVAGPLDFDLTGVVSSLTAPLADAGVPVFVLSTFDTDWLLVRHANVDEAVHALVHAGHVIRA